MTVVKKKESIEKMFNDIAFQYDFLNHFLSLGIDVLWRKKLVLLLKPKEPLHILDVATGTGDLAIALTRLKPEKIIGIDIAEKMLEIARKKIRKKGLEDQISFGKSDVMHIPFSDQSFDAVTVAFGVRNFEDLKMGLLEMKRILRPGGCMMILEFSHPRATPFKQLYQLYSRYFIPFFGRLISRHHGAYTYLPVSVANFPSGNDFLDVLKSLDLKNCKMLPLSFGVASIYYGEK